ncbi:MFS transporter, PPP family, 3-phenylpropionic acid transporter [Insolitispirillum peregrinum]|uniref:MFS transporter, PPP family, 3-phenylpropionic acid transporter n=2 Tax=Insolitispirillum peregrinum TaxID=80876 RepID=A0A1N7IT14_9PROT|nr:MFS transporter, PPP family, 3-phenylpropionic acid transporter [Insolitispirillum peregrinum]
MRALPLAVLHMTSRPPVPPRSSEGLRLGFLYAALFSVIGVQMPFWPLWLKDRGMQPVEIGILLGAIYWAKVVTNPLIAQFVDSRGHRRMVMIALASASMLLYALYPFAYSFPALLCLGVLAGSLLAGLMPLTETITMTLTTQGRLDYGRTRLWGSLSFIALSALAGQAVDHWAASGILWLILLGVAATVVTVVRAPDPPLISRSGPKLPFRALFRNRRYLLFLGTAAITQASHCVYYGFATLYWQSQGLDGGTIGLLWSIGVVAEIALFAFSGRIVQKVGADKLVLFGAVTGIVRWAALAFITSPLGLAPFQTLHAATFGATHLGAMHTIARDVDPRLQVRAQALYSSVAMGLIPGIALLAAGPAYQAFGGLAFLGAMVLSILASLCGYAFVRSPR